VILILNSIHINVFSCREIYCWIYIFYHVTLSLSLPVRAIRLWILGTEMRTVKSKFIYKQNRRKNVYCLQRALLACGLVNIFSSYKVIITLCLWDNNTFQIEDHERMLSFRCLVLCIYFSLSFSLNCSLWMISQNGCAIYLPLWRTKIYYSYKQTHILCRKWNIKWYEAWKR